MTPPHPEFAEILDEFVLAVQEGRPIAREEFLAAHPECADELRRALAGFDFIAAAGGDTSPADEVSGTLGDFRLVREIGRGGMGVVYEAEQLSLGRRVALKVLPFAAVLDDRQLQRFKQEAQSAALLHHTNIVPVYAVGTERGVHYYAMQLVEGRTLADVIAELRAAAPVARGVKSSARRARNPRPSPPREGDSPSSAEALALTPSGSNETPDYCRAIARLGVQAAEGLDHAHENGVVHRDVKPANLMVDARGHMWIADFGLALSRTNPGVTMTGAIVGTVRYMSPEQALAKRVPLDHRTDVYSLGVTLYEALTLEPAFPGDDAQAVMQDIAFLSPEEPHRLNAAISSALETIVLKAVAKDPDTRYATAREMADDLRRYLDDKPVLARRPPLVDRLALWAKRHRAAVVAAAAVLVVAVMALAVSNVKIAAEKHRTDVANEETKAALDESMRNAARAEENFGKALDAVDRMLTRTGLERLAGVPGFEQVRRKLLEDAVEFYRDYLGAQAADPRVRIEAARSLARVARLYCDLADFRAAEASIDRADAMLQEFVPKDDAWTPVLHDIVDAKLIRSRILISAWRKTEAVDVLETALALAERNALARPQDPRCGPCVVKILHGLAGQLMDLGFLARADELLAVAASRQAEALARSPDDDEVREGRTRIEKTIADLAFATGRFLDGQAGLRAALASCQWAAERPADSAAFGLWADLLHSLGERLMELGQLEEAESFLRQAAVARSRRASEFPRFPGFAVAAADSFAVLSSTLERLGRAPEAKAALGDALGRYQRFLGEFGEVVELRESVASSQRHLGRLFNSSGRIDEARTAYETSVDLYRDLVAGAASAPVMQERLAEALGSLGAVNGLPADYLVAKLKESVTLLEAAVARSEAIPRPRERLAFSLNALSIELYHAGDLGASLPTSQQSIDEYRRLVADFPKGHGFKKGLAIALLNRGDDLRVRKRFDEAQTALDESISIFAGLDPHAAGDIDLRGAFGCALFNRALLDEARGRPAAAVPVHRQALAIREELHRRLPLVPQHSGCLASSLHNLGRILRKAKRPAEAEPLLVRATELCRGLAHANPGAVGYRREQRANLFQLAAVLRDLARNAETEPLMRENAKVGEEIVALAPTPNDRMLWIVVRTELAQFLFDRGGADEAERGLLEVVAHLHTWAAKSPDVYGEHLPVALWSLGVCYTRAHRTREAIDIYNELNKLDPANLNACNNLVLALADAEDAALRNRPRAVQLARRAVDLPAEKPYETWALLGYALACGGEWKHALDAFATAVERNGGAMTDDEFGTYLVYVALCHARLGDMPAARDWHRRACAWIADLYEGDPVRAQVLRRRDEVASLLSAADEK